MNEILAVRVQQFVEAVGPQLELVVGLAPLAQLELVVGLVALVVGAASTYLAARALRTIRRTRTLEKELADIQTLQEELQHEHEQVSHSLEVNEKIRQWLEEKPPDDEAMKKDKRENERAMRDAKLLLRRIEVQQRHLDLQKALLESKSRR